MSKKHWASSSTVWGMGATAAACLAMAIAGHKFPDWIPASLAEAAEGAAIAALGAIALRFRTLSLKRSDGRRPEGG
jgi:uncharacterized membrane protein YccC